VKWSPATRPKACVLLLVAAMVVAACVTTDARVQEARGIADGYLTAVSTDTPDRGWSLLHPMAQAVYGPYERYVATAAAIDWSGFRWRQLGREGSARCDDGVICAIELEVEGGLAGIPRFLIEPEWDDEIGVAGVLQVSEQGTQVRIVVLFDTGVGFDQGIGPAGVAAQRGS
jgi:hypothetical protein